MHIEVLRSDKETLLESVLATKIIGKAHKDTRYKQIDSYEKFKALYGTWHIIAALQVKFNTYNQKPNESVLAYGQRLETIMMKLIDTSTAKEATAAGKKTIETYVQH